MKGSCVGVGRLGTNIKLFFGGDDPCLFPLPGQHEFCGSRHQKKVDVHGTFCTHSPTIYGFSPLSELPAKLPNTHAPLHTQPLQPSFPSYYFFLWGLGWSSYVLHPFCLCPEKKKNFFRSNIFHVHDFTLWWMCQPHTPLAGPTRDGIPPLLLTVFGSSSATISNSSWALGLLFFFSLRSMWLGLEELEFLSSTFKTWKLR